MSTVNIAPGDLVLKDPSASQVYRFSWDLLGSGVTIAFSKFKVTGANALGRALTLPVTSLTFDGINIQVTTGVAHGYSTADVITIAGALEEDYNQAYIVTVLTPTTFEAQAVGLPATATGTITAAKGLDQGSILTDAPYNDRFTEVRFTGGVLGAQYVIANRIVTNEAVIQIKERSFQILIENL